MVRICPKVLVRLLHPLLGCRVDDYQRRESPMPKRKSKNSGAIARGQELEVQHLAETTDLSPNRARELLRRHGNDWEKIRQEAETFKAEG